MNFLRKTVLAFCRSALALALVASAAAEADQAVAPLGILIGDADAIALGVVAGTSEGQLPGEFLLDVEVEEALKGPPLARFTLLGNDRNSDSFTRMGKGTRILAFLQGDGSVRVPISGEIGIVELNDTSFDTAREVVLRGLKLGGQVGLLDFEDLLAKGTPVPRPLLGSVTEELSLRLSQKDQGLIGEMACDPQQFFLPAVQLWAISQVGPLQVADARLCLEKFIGDKKDEARAIAASEALGELGDPDSVRPLIRLLATLPADPRIVGRDRRGDSAIPTGGEDPEDESNAEPDKDEASAPGETERTPVPPPSSDRDGDKEPDNAPSRDRAVRGAGGGLAEASILALGKVGDTAAVPILFRIAQQGDDFSLQSTAVNALGLIGGRTVLGPLRALSRTHTNPLVREQAKETYERLRKK